MVTSSGSVRPNYARRGARFEQELRASQNERVVLVKVPVGTTSGMRFSGGGYVDFVGVIDGVPVAIEAKSCSSGRFRLDRVTDNQYYFLQKFSAAGGLSMILVRYKCQIVRVAAIVVEYVMELLQSGVSSLDAKDLMLLPQIPRQGSAWDLTVISTLWRR